MKIINLNVGDILYCYKDSKYVYMSNIIHKKNNTYKIKSILKIKDDSFGSPIICINIKNNFLTNYDDNYYIYWIIDKNCEEYKSSMSSNSNLYLLEDYFLTPKQYRKLKLTSLLKNDK